MSELTSIPSTNEIHKGLHLLGLSLSELELNDLKIGQTISLETRSLGEIGSMFILAAALSAVNLGKTKKTVTFGDLPQVVNESANSPGIPIYCWISDTLNKKCLYLTLVDGKPALRITKHFQ
ncbi:MAG: hypothetical protein AB3A66_06565 [Nodularia sp. CChRGM 3473]